jgi:hypothetical protein
MSDVICFSIALQIWLGNVNAAKDLQGLLRVGVSHVINCAALQCPAFYPQVGLCEVPFVPQFLCSRMPHCECRLERINMLTDLEKVPAFHLQVRDAHGHAFAKYYAALWGNVGFHPGGAQLRRICFLALRRRQVSVSGMCDCLFDRQ